MSLLWLLYFLPSNLYVASFNCLFQGIDSNCLLKLNIYVHEKHHIFKFWILISWKVCFFPKNYKTSMEHFHEIFCNFSRGANLSASENWWWRWDQMVVIIYVETSKIHIRSSKDSNSDPPVFWLLAIRVCEVLWLACPSVTFNSTPLRNWTRNSPRNIIKINCIGLRD